MLPMMPLLKTINVLSFWIHLISLYCNLIKETINNAKNSIPVPEPRKEAAEDNKEKTQGKTVQEIDREKLEQKFSKDKKETLN